MQDLDTVAMVFHLKQKTNKKKTSLLAAAFFKQKKRSWSYTVTVQGLFFLCNF